MRWKGYRGRHTSARSASRRTSARCAS
jgi:hypothetical protein